MDDVCFVLEGTYPFLRGGVSSWTHNLIEDMRELKFSLLAISPVKGPYKKYEYSIPDNVANIVETFLYLDDLPNQACPNKKNKDVFWNTFYDYLTGKNDQYGDHFKKIYPLLCDAQLRAVNAQDLIYSTESHELTEKMYEEKKKDNCSFFDFFWTWRSMLLVFIHAINVEIPPARAYHTTCTGYAGLVGVLAK
jgi:hypothetical protein